MRHWVRMLARSAVVVALWGVAALAVTGCAGTPAAGGLGGSGALAVVAPADRRPAPELSGELLSGDGSFHLADHAGDVIVVNFWASWCGPCVTEADDLESVYRSTRSLGVTFVGVNVRDERDKARAFVVGRSTYPSVFDPASRMALGFSVPPTSIPATIVIDRQGRIAATAFGAVLAVDLERVVTELAAESASLRADPSAESVGGAPSG